MWTFLRHSVVLLIATRSPATRSTQTRHEEQLRQWTSLSSTAWLKLSTVALTFTKKSYLLTYFHSYCGTSDWLAAWLMLWCWCRVKLVRLESWTHTCDQVKRRNQLHQILLYTHRYWGTLCATSVVITMFLPRDALHAPCLLSLLDLSIHLWAVAKVQQIKWFVETRLPSLCHTLCYRPKGIRVPPLL